MSGLEKITAKILSEAEAVVASEIEKANKDSEEMVSNAKAKAEAEAEHLIIKAEQDAKNIIERRRSVAQLEARKLNLSVKQEVANEAFDLAIVKLKSMPKEDYVSFLANSIVSTAKGTEEIVLSKKDKEEIAGDLIQKIYEKNSALIGIKTFTPEKSSLPVIDKLLGMVKDNSSGLTISSEAANIDSGYILRENSTEINMSFEALLKDYKNDLLLDVVSILFPENTN